MGKVDRLRNRVIPFAALFWALDVVLDNTWPCPQARHHSTSVHKYILMWSCFLYSGGELVQFSTKTICPPPFSYLGCYLLYDLQWSGASLSRWTTQTTSTCWSTGARRWPTTAACASASTRSTSAAGARSVPLSLVLAGELYIQTSKTCLQSEGSGEMLLNIDYLLEVVETKTLVICFLSLCVGSYCLSTTD